MASSSLYSSSSSLPLAIVAFAQTTNLAHGCSEACRVSSDPLIALVGRSDGQKMFCPA